jgi:hypothetical protein
MYCTKCGAPNDDNAYKCVRCAAILQEVAPRKIDNHLALAIVVTVLCCLPFGIVGIVHAAQVNGKAQAGDIAGAEEYARKAKYWSLWGLALGLVAYGGYVLIMLAGAVAGAASR